MSIISETRGTYFLNYPPGNYLMQFVLENGHKFDSLISIPYQVDKKQIIDTIISIKPNTKHGDSISKDSIKIPYKMFRETFYTQDVYIGKQIKLQNHFDDTSIMANASPEKLLNISKLVPNYFPTNNQKIENKKRNNGENHSPTPPVIDINTPHPTHKDSIKKGGELTIRDTSHQPIPVNPVNTRKNLIDYGKNDDPSEFINTNPNYFTSEFEIKPLPNIFYNSNETTIIRDANKVKYLAMLGMILRSHPHFQLILSFGLEKRSINEQRKQELITHLSSTYLIPSNRIIAKFVNLKSSPDEVLVEISNTK